MNFLASARASSDMSRIGVSLRYETADDAGWITALYAASRDDEMAALPWPAVMKAGFLAEQARLRNEHHATAHPNADRLVATIADVRAGRLLIDRTVSPWRLVDLAITPEHQGRRVGTALLRWLQREGRREGIDLHVAQDNVGAARLYRRLGFASAHGGSATHARMEWPGR